MMNLDTARSSLELLYSVSRDLANEIELRPLIKRILTQSVHNVGAERGSLVVLTEQNKPVDAAIIYGDKIYSHTLQQLKETVDKGMAGWVVKHHKCVLVNDTREDQRWVRRPDDETNKTGSKSALCVPLMAHRKLVGVLTVVHPTVGFFNPEHLSLLQSIGDIAGIAIVNARLYEESQRRSRVMSALIDNAISLNSSLNLNEVFQRLMEQTAQALRVELAALGFLGPTAENIEIQAAWGNGAQQFVNIALPIDEGFTELTMRSGKAMFGSPTDLKNFIPIQGKPIHGLAVAPVRVKDDVTGMLLAINPKGEEFDPDALVVLTAIGAMAGTAIQNARNFEQVESSSQRYGELFDNHIDPIIITDLQGEILEANCQACDVLQYTKEQLVKQHIRMLHEPKVDKVGPDFGLIPSAGALNYEGIMTSHNNWEVPVEVSIRRIHYGGNDALQWVMRDIRERIDLDLLRNDLTAMVYHDLRSPLANVTASLDILSSLTNGNRDDTTVSLLNIAMRSSDRIQRLLNSLLDIYRLEAGQDIINRKDIHPLTLANEVIEILQPALDAKNQSVMLTIPKDLPQVSVDNDMIRRVLVNLVENASKFSPIDARIDVTAELKNGSVEFRIKDDGPGIAQEDQQKIFEKFSRLKMSGSAKGIGLGLTFCRLAVSGHGGQIWVESNPGQGSTFYFTLPLKNVADQPA